MIKAVIFDMDDLMVNSHPLQLRATELALKKHNRSFKDMPKDFESKTIGMRVKDICSEMLKHLQLGVSLEDFYRKRSDIFLELVKKGLKAMPGPVESLKLAKKHGLKIGLATSGAKEYVDLVLNKFKIRHYFDAIVTGDEVTYGKPHPESYQVAARKLGFKPKECLVLEDATKGIASAKAAGAYCAAVKNSNTPAQDHSKADFILPSLLHLSVEHFRRFAH